MKNIMLPSPHKIISVLKETKAEYTFRVEYDGETDHGQFFQLSIPKIGEAPISVSGKGNGYVEFTIRKIGRLTDGIFGLNAGDTYYYAYYDTLEISITPDFGGGFMFG